MIIFNNLGHTFKPADDGFPIVWVDSSDSSTYTLSGNDVLTLDNKGSLGGAMTLNGTVKFANSGFESWNNADYITRDLSEPFMNDNSFTVATTFDFQNNTGAFTQWFSEIRSDNSNRVNVNREGNIIYQTVRTLLAPQSITNGLKTSIVTYDLTSNSAIILKFDGSNVVGSNIIYNNTLNSIITLLNSKQINTSSSGANNPLHEFRLYDRAMSFEQMQDLQTELNNKYTP